MTGKAQTLHGEERDEIEALVMRIKRADEKVRRPDQTAVVAEADVVWAEQNQLPREFFEFFELQRA